MEVFVAAGMLQMLYVPGVYVVGGGTPVRLGLWRRDHEPSLEKWGGRV